MFKVSYLYLLLNIFYQSLIAIALETVRSWYFLESGNFCFATKNFSRSTAIYAFFPQNSRTGSLKTPITREWLAVESWSIDS